MTTHSPKADAVLLTAQEAAGLLKVHVKQVYRLVRQGLPGRRVGGEWRFVREEVMAWIGGGAEPPAAPPERPSPQTPPLLAANGDVVVELLLEALNAGAPALGLVQSDCAGGVTQLQTGAVLAAGSHGRGAPGRLGSLRLARLHLVRREVGLAGRAGGPAPRAGDLARCRLAARPATAGVVVHLERALTEAGLDGGAVLRGAVALSSHRDVVLALLRGEADAGLVTHAWAARAGLPFRSLAEEEYGLLVRACDLGDPRVVRLCEITQGARYRAALAAIAGYDAVGAGDIRFDPDGP